mmetsp:Transcript_28762/g.72274  ORF Transcript_28762/g.72274 Transcript_28762/m.72274 type:complete len:257 (+) Transcript_28762:694-1464(+)
MICLAISSGTAHMDDSTTRAPALTKARGRPSTPSSHRSPPPEWLPTSATTGWLASQVMCTWSLCSSPSSSSLSTSSPPPTGASARHLGWACTAKCSSAGGRTTSASSTVRARASAPVRTCTSSASLSDAPRSMSAMAAASSSAPVSALSPSVPSVLALPTTSAAGSPPSTSRARSRARMQRSAAAEGAMETAVVAMSGLDGSEAGASAQKGTSASTPLGITTSSAAPASAPASGSSSPACSAPRTPRAVVAASASS